MKPENKRKLQEQMLDAKMTQSEIARRTGKSRQTINDIIWGRSNNKKLIARVVGMIGFDFTIYHN